MCRGGDDCKEGLGGRRSRSATRAAVWSAKAGGRSSRRDAPRARRWPPRRVGASVGQDSGDSTTRGGAGRLRDEAPARRSPKAGPTFPARSPAVRRLLTLGGDRRTLAAGLSLPTKEDQPVRRLRSSVSTVLTAALVALTVGAVAPRAAHADAGSAIRITEFAYGGLIAGSRGDGEYVEVTNVGDGPQDMTGWSYGNRPRTAGPSRCRDSARSLPASRRSSPTSGGCVPHRLGAETRQDRQRRQPRLLNKGPERNPRLRQHERRGRLGLVRQRLLVRQGPVRMGRHGTPRREGRHDRAGPSRRRATPRDPGRARPVRSARRAPRPTAPSSQRTSADDRRRRRDAADRSELRRHRDQRDHLRQRRNGFAPLDANDLIELYNTGTHARQPRRVEADRQQRDGFASASDFSAGLYVNGALATVIPAGGYGVFSSGPGL